MTCVLGCESRQRGDTPELADTPSAIDSGAAPVDEPVFEIALWPGEGIPVLEGVADTLTLRAEPLVRSAAIATLVGMRGAGVTYDSTRYQTIVPVRAIAQDSVLFRGRDFGAVRLLLREQYTANVPTRVVSVGAGATIDYLQARAEGTCFVRLDSTVLEAEQCVVLDRSRFAVQGQPETRWWVHVTRNDGAGWLLISDSTVRVVRRTF
ncbi:MAG: hypothetical protein AB1762_00900 [Gemmatimonadota bacterium]